MKHTLYFKITALAVLFSCAHEGVAKTRQPMQDATCSMAAADSKGCCCPTRRFDGEISWNPDEMHYNIKQQSGPLTPALFQPYLTNGYYDVLSGWVMPSPVFTQVPPFVVTAEFQVPHDLDPSVTPVVVLHWFNPNQVTQECTGNYLKWQVTADFFTNLATINGPTATPKYVLTSSDVQLTFFTGASAEGLVQQQVSVPLTGPALVPGAYAQISVERIAPTGAGHVQSTCDVYLSVITLQYRKKAQ